MLSYNEITNNEDIKTYIHLSDKFLADLGYSEHNLTHVKCVAKNAAHILKSFNYNEREIELVKIASYLHDIGNIINRNSHSELGGLMAFNLLKDLGMSKLECALIANAIGNHDVDTGIIATPISAALVIADKSDIRRSRVRNKEISEFDIHDKVNYSTIKSQLIVENSPKKILLNITLDENYSNNLAFFEIFLSRMLYCKKAAKFLNAEFSLNINGVNNEL